MRYIFYGTIILVFLLLLLIIDQAIYWTCRIFVQKHLAQILRLCIDATLVIIIFAASLWGHYFTRFEVNVTHTQVVSKRWPKSFEGYRIAQISDLHLDCFNSPEGHAFLNRIIQSIEAEHPDLIVFTGDIVSRQSSEAEPFKKELYRLAHIPYHKDDSFIPVYSILGNHDYADYTGKSIREKILDVNNLCSIQQEAGWNLLRNESLLLHASDSSQSIQLIGVENIGEPPFSTYGDLKKALSTCQDSIDKSTAKILLSHNPTHWRNEVLPTSDIDLMLAGHTHAVQLQIGNWSPAKWKYPEWEGLYETSTQTAAEAQTRAIDSHPQYLYVNTGIGGVGPRVRIGVKPEISILILCSK